MAFTASTFSAASSDQDVQTSQPVYPPTANFQRDSAGTTVDAIRTKDGSGFFYISCGLLAFDTSSLPDDSVIVDAKLKFRATFKLDDDSRSLTGEQYDWDGTSVTDHTDTAASGLFSLALSGVSTTTTTEVELSGLTVNLSGLTKIRLHISGGEPTGKNRLSIAAYEHATLLEPQLLLTYTGPPVPRSFSEGSLAFSGSCVVPMPTPIPQEDDLILCALAFSETGAEITPDAGFTLIGREDGTGLSGAVFWKRATASEADDYPDGYSFGFDAPTTHKGDAACYTGANVAVPAADADAQANAASTSIAAPSVAATDYTKLLYVGMQSGTATFTPPSGMTERAD